MPFNWREDREEQIVELLKVIARNQKMFQLNIKGFGFFKPGVIFLEPLFTAELFSIQKEVAQLFSRLLNANTSVYKNKAFHPHFTIAFRDLKKSMFNKAYEEFSKKTYKTNFIVSSLSLLKHNGKCWEECKTIELRKIDEALYPS